jgi:hypothetical protein
LKRSPNRYFAAHATGLRRAVWETSLPLQQAIRWLLIQSNIERKIVNDHIIVVSAVVQRALYKSYGVKSHSSNSNINYSFYRVIVVDYGYAST